ncbi:Spo0J and IME4 domain-containing protein [Methylocella sp.]|jgi:ParB family chromosome partitioning protein|uniref:Spo0J and IME4 domain-containing protein n=1 Tax=Methylocella sp. TaxID=1978226 RepID=UPI003C25B2BD
MNPPRKLRVASINIAEGRRPVNPAAVDSLAQSMKNMGLRTPITVRMGGSVPWVIAGAHRLAAAKQLGWKTIACDVAEGMKDEDARLWEISENLHRAELTALEHDTQFDEYAKIMEARRKPGQVEPVSKGGRGNEGGVNKAARDLGIEPSAAQRAVTVAGLSAEAKEAARDTGLDHNRSAMLEAAKAAPDKQAEAIRDIAASKMAPPAQPAEASSAPGPRYGVLYADFADAALRPVHAAVDYTYSDLLPADISDIAADDAVLFLWASGEELHDALKFIADAGFDFKDQLVWHWHKDGARAPFALRKHTNLLVATRGKPPKPTIGGYSSAFHATVEGRAAKPGIVYRLITETCPGLSRVELFAKNEHDGWSAWPPIAAATPPDFDDPFAAARPAAAAAPVCVEEGVL